MTAKETFEGLIAAFESKNLESVMKYFAEDAVLYDPHYPVPRMMGTAAIRQGMEWGLGNMEKPGFAIRHYWDDGRVGAAELDTHHVFKGGMELKIDQVFVFEVEGNKFKRMQSYVPYSPPGISGLLTKVTRLIWRLQGKLK
ncbi:MAG: nuclear transport factor 2 family protein [Ardenticatenaceae bacterium]|nr:nuclear transport factor 2 family protein [Anaerolineales bacterium]MCB8922160.1 nuclear transport factor 2 family protein [Ardenticatenaceae bacterium]MCB8991140.1 nuclear transport factor 2 family protein [Ardenticatenaceae bacterium]MCB9005296.1 nuclear transport factor 2 family protein [Ardenticatenaceae bacterium]